ncbi:MAG: ATP-binding protein [Armatimonadota bacterium]
MNQRGDRLRLTMPTNVKYLETARLLAAGVGARAELNIEQIEDLKVAVSEACTNVCEHAYDSSSGEVQQPQMTIDFYVGDNEVTVEVEDEGRGFDPKHIPDREQWQELGEDAGLGLFLIHELMDEVQIQSAPGSGTKIIMTKRASR